MGLGLPPAGGTLLVNVSAQFLGCPRCNVAQTTALVTLASTVSLRLLRPAGWNSYSPTTARTPAGRTSGAVKRCKGKRVRLRSCRVTAIECQQL